MFCEHFSKLNAVDSDDDIIFFLSNKISYFNNELNCPFTISEVSKTISNLKTQKACSAEHYLLNEYI